jgi:acyl carrier protein
MMTKTIDRAAAVREIRAKVLELARARGLRGGDLRDDQLIPESGLLDSAGIMELIVWYETRFGLEIEQDELTVDNFGTVNGMADYLTRT